MIGPCALEDWGSAARLAYVNYEKELDRRPLRKPFQRSVDRSLGGLPVLDLDRR